VGGDGLQRDSKQSNCSGVRKKTGGEKRTSAQNKGGGEDFHMTLNGKTSVGHGKEAPLTQFTNWLKGSSQKIKKKYSCSLNNKEIW